MSSRTEETISLVDAICYTSRYIFFFWTIFGNERLTYKYALLEEILQRVLRSVAACRLIETIGVPHFGFIVLEIHSHCGGPRSIFVRDCPVFRGQWPCGRGELDGHVVIGAFLQHFVRSVPVQSYVGIRRLGKRYRANQQHVIPIINYKNFSYSK